MDLSVVPYSHISPSESAPDNNKKVEKNGHGNGRVVDPLESPEKPARNIGIQYRECLKNHAASIGGHANDGCGEFMPGGEDGTMEALKCAACGCHRNFHRKELPGCDYPVPTGFCYNAGPGWDFPGKKKMGFPALPPILPHVDLHQRAQSVVENKCSEEQDQTGSLARKRFRTKFTQDQKDKMLAFAEKLGWRIQKHDDVALQQFCMEVGVKRHVLKVWMHNNKNTLGKKEAVTI